MRIIQNRMSVEKWLKHFREQAAGVQHPTRNGYTYVNQVGSGPGSSNIRHTPVKLISPVQQGIEQAKAEIKRERKGIKRASSFGQPQMKKKPRGGKRPSVSSNKKKPKPLKKGSVNQNKKKVNNKIKKPATNKKNQKKDIFGK
jgi:hypothetical protein